VCQGKHEKYEQYLQPGKEKTTKSKSKEKQLAIAQRCEC